MRLGVCTRVLWAPLETLRVPLQALIGTVCNVLSTTMSVLMGTCAKLAGARCAPATAIPTATAAAAAAAAVVAAAIGKARHIRTASATAAACTPAICCKTYGMLPDGPAARCLKLRKGSQHVGAGAAAEICAAMSRSRIIDRILALFLSPVAVDKACLGRDLTC